MPMIRLTRREREVLVELCRPILERASFHEPAPTRDIARALLAASGERAGAALELEVAREAFGRLGLEDHAIKAAEVLTLTSG
jgi:hypothetical protein